MLPAWDGNERRTAMHDTPLAECIERYKRLEDKIMAVLSVVQEVRLEQVKINTRYEKHLEEAIPYRSQVDAHETRFEQNDVHGRWLVGILVSILVTIFLQIGTFVYLWGRITKQVEINTVRMTSIEDLHPRNSLSIKGGG